MGQRPQTVTDAVDRHSIKFERVFFQLAQAAVKLELRLVRDAKVVEAATIWGRND
jgi:hypothetical protein